MLQATFDQGLALHRAGRLDEATKRYETVLLRDPRHFDALRLLGTIHVMADRPEQGVGLLRRAIKVRPDVPTLHGLLGSTLGKLGRHEEALAAYDRAIALEPDLAKAHYHRGIALTDLKRFDAALDSYDRAIALEPDYAAAHYNRGIVLQRLLRHEAGLASYDRAIALNLDLPQVHYDRGVALHILGRPQEALESYDKALMLKPDYADALMGRSLVRLLLGQFEAGWREYEWRGGNLTAAATPIENRLSLDPADLNGKTVFLYCEQGLGDTIQFSRYIPDLERRGAKIVLSAHTPLKSLLQQLAPTIEIIGEGERPSRFDDQCALMSLPLVFRTTLETIPPPRRLRADEARRAHFAARLGPKTKPRVGIAWSGNPSHEHDHNRSIAFDKLQPLLTDEADWTALQNQIRPGDAAAFERFGRVGFHGDDLKDFNDTAALLDLMDLVIAVDTSIAHLAGAMGKPVWILLPFSPDWRWLLGRDDSPWYPSARLFRQSRMGDWSSVFEAVGRALGELTG